MSSHDIYPSLSGAAASWRHLEVVANNLANTSSTGFKEQRVAFELADRGDEPLASSMVQLDTEGADLSDGPVNQTGVRTNLALRGRGFFLAQARHQPRRGLCLQGQDCTNVRVQIMPLVPSIRLLLHYRQLSRPNEPCHNSKL